MEVIDKQVKFLPSIMYCIHWDQAIHIIWWALMYLDISLVYEQIDLWWLNTKMSFKLLTVVNNITVSKHNKEGKQA